MKTALFVVLALSVVALADLPPPPPKLPVQARELSADDVQKLLTARKDIGILDVRTAEEAAELGRLPGAKHLDFFREDFAKELTKLSLDPAKPCVVYCALGGRARRAAEKLAATGFKEIILLKDGFNAWKKAAKPIEGGNAGK